MSEYLLPFALAIMPRQGANRIPQVAFWWRPLLTAALTATAAALLSHSLAVAITLSHLPPSATADDILKVRQWLAEGVGSRALLIPFRVAGECATMALLLLGFARAFTGRSAGSFRGFFVLSLSASVIPALWRCAGVGWYTLAGGAPQGLIRPLISAADMLPTGSDYRFILLLTSANLSTLWYVGVVAVGLTVLCRCKAGKAILVAVAAWTVSAAFSIIVLLLIRNAFAFLV
jgi:hypothetical protein